MMAAGAQDFLSPTNHTQTRGLPAPRSYCKQSDGTRDITRPPPNPAPIPPLRYIPGLGEDGGSFVQHWGTCGFDSVFSGRFRPTCSRHRPPGTANASRTRMRLVLVATQSSQECTQTTMLFTLSRLILHATGPQLPTKTAPSGTAAIQRCRRIHFR